MSLTDSLTKVSEVSRAMDGHFCHGDSVLPLHNTVIFPEAFYRGDIFIGPICKRNVYSWNADMTIVPITLYVPPSSYNSLSYR